jgi:hypothetical protein
MKDHVRWARTRHHIALGAVLLALTGAGPAWAALDRETGGADPAPKTPLPAATPTPTPDTRDDIEVPPFNVGLSADAGSDANKKLDRTVERIEKKFENYEPPATDDKCGDTK